MTKTDMYDFGHIQGAAKRELLFHKLAFVILPSFPPESK
jgi:hypothetical protein